MREFVMGDIHGACKAMRQCLQRAAFDYKNDRLIQLGDIVDRQAGVFECVEELLKIKHLIVVRGNHDDWFDEFCQTGHHPAHWWHGGVATAQSYWRHAHSKEAHPPDDQEIINLLRPEHIPEKHRRFFAGLPLYHVDAQGRCFVHAGFNRFAPFTGQPSSIYFWDRELWTAALEWQENERLTPGQPPFQIKTKFREIFIGHTPTTGWNSIVPMRAAHVYNLDTGAGQVGRLTIMDLATKKYWQSEPVASLYEKNRGMTVME
jgi:serine/threonine protein phosphatase 1